MRGPVELLAEGVDSLAVGLQPSGVLHDPVFDAPTQYGGAFYAWCASVLADHPAVSPAERERWRHQSRICFDAALRHTTDPTATPYASGFDRRSLSVVGHLNHRDFTWSPIMKTYQADSELHRPWSATVAALDIATSFRTRPPSNWAAVWLSGEALRMRCGLSPTTDEQLDQWIAVFFARPEGVGLDTDLGMYRERGLPNAYDLFTRTHLTELLAAGYAGQHLEPLRAFLSLGLRRSLEIQLSDGSVASGYRSTGQTWVLGAEIALFTLSERLGLGDATDRHHSRNAAWRAFRSLSTWRRSTGEPFSPVQNSLPAELRVGYERYTADGHYSPLALGFLATAVRSGFGDDPAPTTEDLDVRPSEVRAEGSPVFRAVAHRGRISIGVQAQADRTYDATGLVDLTFGAGRLLHFVSAARHVSGGDWIVPGLAVRVASGSAPIQAIGSRHHHCTGLDGAGSAGVTFRSILQEGQTADQEPDLLADRHYDFTARLAADGVTVAESFSGPPCHRTLLIPYLRDPGTGATTRVSPVTGGVRLELVDEWVEILVDAPVERRSHAASGFESRRGWCGLIRLDLLGVGNSLSWSVHSGQDRRIADLTVAPSLG